MKKYKIIFLLLLLPYPLTALSHNSSVTLSEDKTQFFSGKAIGQTLVIKDLPERRDVECVWKTLVETAVIEKGGKPIRQNEGRDTRVRVILHLPEVTRQVKLTWVVEVRSGGELLGSSVFYYLIFPRDNAEILREVLWRRRIGIFDPGGGLKELFTSLGVSYSDISSDLSLKLFRGDALIIGPGAVSNPWSNLFHLLTSDPPFEGGILCLRQSMLPDDLPISILSGISPGADDPTVMASGHPIFLGLSSDDFRGWERENNPALFINKPSRGNYRSLLELPTRGENRKASLLLENIMDGRTILFCQFPVSSSFRSNPIAGILLANMLRFIVQSSPVNLFAPSANREEALLRNRDNTFSPDAVKNF